MQSIKLLTIRKSHVAIPIVIRNMAVLPRTFMSTISHRRCRKKCATVFVKVIIPKSMKQEIKKAECRKKTMITVCSSTINLKN